MEEGKPKVLLLLTGSVAAIKARILEQQLSRFAEVKVAASHRAAHFVGVADAPPEPSPGAKVLVDDDEWHWKTRGDAVLHIELRRWADLAVVAPLSANSLGKMANGIADTLVCAVLRAWDFSKPLLLAPAMNTAMWEHPITKTQLNAIQSWSSNILVIPPVEKVLVCGDSGNGAMASVDTVVEAVRKQLILRKLLSAPEDSKSLH